MSLVIGDPPRPMKLKRTPDPDLSRGNTAWAARSQAMAALEKAKKHNIRDVELYIESPQWTRAELQAHWSKPDATSVETPGPVFDQDYISSRRARGAGGLRRGPPPCPGR